MLSNIDNSKRKIGKLIWLIKEDNVGGLAWIQLKNLGTLNKGIQRILEKMEKKRLMLVSNLFEEFDFSKEEASVKAKGFMYLMIGWSILYWNDPEAKKNPEKELLTLMELLGLHGIEIK